MISLFSLITSSLSYYCLIPLLTLITIIMLIILLLKFTFDNLSGCVSEINKHQKPQAVIPQLSIRAIFSKNLEIAAHFIASKILNQHWLIVLITQKHIKNRLGYTALIDSIRETWLIPTRTKIFIRFSSTPDFTCCECHVSIMPFGN